MDKGYEAFCLNDSVFYDTPTTARDDDVDLEVLQRPTPSGWSRAELEDWLVYVPDDADLPQQGWKIHASASLGDADKIAGIVWDYCVEHQIAFKIVRSAQLLLLANSKYANRGSSGKFATIYPVDDEQFEVTLNELGLALAGFEGPYILSDVRWGDGPLYMRYGGFAERFCLSDSGEVTPAIERPDGQLVPDRRGTVFWTPDWVTVPPCVQAAITARSSVDITGLPYTIERALHFSNGGGVYVATDTRDGEKVVLKEARPHAGLAIDGSDAVARLDNEHTMMLRLEGLGVVPRVKERFTLGGHHFLVEEFVDAMPLARTMVDTYPLALLGDDKPFDEYTAWALDQVDRLAVALDAIHGRGVVIGDLHPQNVLVRPNGEIVLVDLEVASDVAAGARPALADPGYAPPHGVFGQAVDEYALACITISLFVPLTELIALDPGKVQQFAREIIARFPIPAERLAHAVQTISQAHGDAAMSPPTWPVTFEADPERWPELRDCLANAIVCSATPGRDDRLFPGDIAQFESGGLNIAYGAAGVLLALAQTGAGRYPDHEAWLLSRARNPQPGTRFGFYDGLDGVAYALDVLGHTDDALEVLETSHRELGESWLDLGHDLFGGLSGMGLTLLHFSERTGSQRLLQDALEMAEVIADDLGDVDDVPETSGDHDPYAGLTRGSSGPALFFLRLYDRTGNDALLDLAETALRQDLRRCVLREDGALEVNEGYRTMPYLHDGSTGVGVVLDMLLARRPDPALAEMSASIRMAALSEFYIESGLFSGRAGMISYLAGRAAQAPGGDGDAELIRLHVRRLAWHAISYEGSVAFPGDQLLRLSMDLATGTAGVLFGLGSALHDQPVVLPFLDPPWSGSSVSAH